MAKEKKGVKTFDAPDKPAVSTRTIAISVALVALVIALLIWLL